MWFGEDTDELINLKKEYESITGTSADGEMDVEYGQAQYDDYIRDLKICIKEKITLGELYEDDEDW